MPLEEAPYSNRQIERMFDTQKESFDNQLAKQSEDIKKHIDMGLEPVLVQTTKTNGRVSKLERTMMIIIVAIAALYVSNPELLKLILSAV